MWKHRTVSCGIYNDDDWELELIPKHSDSGLQIDFE